MSVFGEELIERLPLSSSLHSKDNPMRKILVDGVGEWLDSFDEDYLGEQVFLDSATGKYLDLWGKDYNVPRKPNESDSVYRERIVYETVGHLTTNYLKDVYGVELYSKVNGFSVADNVLVSDNVYASDKLIGVASSDAVNSLNKKFVMKGIIRWYTGGILDYIINTSDEDVLDDYYEIYNLSDLRNYFKNNSSLKEVFLHLPNATNCWRMFYGCTGLTSVNLDLPNATFCEVILRNSSSLKNVTLNIPKMKIIISANLFNNCPNLETIDLTVPTSNVNLVKNYVTGLNLQYLTSLKINGVEYID